MSGRDSSEFRKHTAKMVVYNNRQLQCRGACKKRRSEGQFAAGENVCKICRLREPRPAANASGNAA